MARHAHHSDHWRQAQAREAVKRELLSALGKLDITEIFKTKGDLKRWSAKRTIGSVIVATACTEIASHGITWEAVTMCAIGVTPLCLSFFEHAAAQS